MICILINGIYISLIAVMSTVTTTDRIGYANLHEWQGGTLMYAHNYLSGAEFYKAETITVYYDDGDTQIFDAIYAARVPSVNWTYEIQEHSTPGTITLVTCSDAGMVYLVQLVPHVESKRFIQ